MALHQHADVVVGSIGLEDQVKRVQDGLGGNR